MPLRCLDPTKDTEIHAFDLPTEEWRALEHKNRSTRHLRMPCCGAQVTLKISRRGTQFFAHKIGGACETAPETEIHLRLKQMAAETARRHGWVAATEVVGTTAAGEQWKADVLAQKGSRKVAVEIQWSAQTNDETLRQQERYAQSGIRCLWLLRRRGFPISKELPAARIGGGIEEGLTAFVGDDQELPMTEFLDAAFDRRLRFGVPRGVLAQVAIHAGSMNCWHRSCGKRTRIITQIEVVFGLHERSFTVAELGDYPGLFDTVRPHLPNGLGIGTIKHRFSNNEGRRYLSNGCAHCDRLMGAFYEHEAWDDVTTVCEFPMRLSDQWRDAVADDEMYGEVGWGVYDPGAIERAA
jgi:hypothetical protein